MVTGIGESNVTGAHECAMLEVEDVRAFLHARNFQPFIVLRGWHIAEVEFVPRRCTLIGDHLKGNAQAGLMIKIGAQTFVSVDDPLQSLFQIQCIEIPLNRNLDLIVPSRGVRLQQPHLFLLGRELKGVNGGLHNCVRADYLSKDDDNNEMARGLSGRGIRVARHACRRLIFSSCPRSFWRRFLK